MCIRDSYRDFEGLPIHSSAELLHNDQTREDFLRGLYVQFETYFAGAFLFPMEKMFDFNLKKTMQDAFIEFLEKNNILKYKKKNSCFEEIILQLDLNWPKVKRSIARKMSCNTYTAPQLMN